MIAKPEWAIRDFGRKVLPFYFSDEYDGQDFSNWYENNPEYDCDFEGELDPDCELTHEQMLDQFSHVFRENFI